MNPRRPRHRFRLDPASALANYYAKGAVQIKIRHRRASESSLPRGRSRLKTPPQNSNSSCPVPTAVRDRYGGEFHALACHRRPRGRRGRRSPTPPRHRPTLLHCPAWPVQARGRPLSSQPSALAAAGTRSWLLGSMTWMGASENQAHCNIVDNGHNIVV